MNWGATSGIVLLTAAAGGGAAAILANFLVGALQIPAREGAAGYFSLFVIVMGVIGGFIVGLSTTLAMTAGFWKVQGYALAITVALTVAAGVITVARDDQGPKLDGDSLVLEVELKCPAGWQPDEGADSETTSFCWLQEKLADADVKANPIVVGSQSVKAVDGRWIVTCGVPLRQTRKNRYLRVFVGQQIDATIQVPLPAKPGAGDKQWNGWRGDGFLAQVGKPVREGYAYRLRVRGASEDAAPH